MTNPSPKRQKVKAGPSSIKDDPVYTSAPQSTTPTTTTTKTTSLRTPFLDAFWKLASDDPSVRSDAAITLIEHCFPTSSSSPSTMGDDDDDDNDSSSNDAAITKDREYALKRLMKGLCSGRGSARQGFASALQSFITASLPTNTYTSSSLHTALISHTLSTTQNSSSKGTEERDALFGTLFGLLAIARSSIFTCSPNLDSAPIDLYVKTALQLYGVKSWMRESALNAVLTILASSPAEVRSALTGTTIQSFVTEKESANTLHAEVLALGVQTKTLPVSSSTLERYTPALVATSSCYPRLHLVWPVLLRAIGPDGSLLRELYEGVVEKHMVRSTHEKKSVPLLLVKYFFDEGLIGEECIPTVLSQPIVLLLLHASTSSSSLPHILQPLGLSSLSSITQFASLNRRLPRVLLSVAAALLAADAKFDGRVPAGSPRVVGGLLAGLTGKYRGEYLDLLEGGVLGTSEEIA
ncbi:hypothetical protein ScalyP_jg2663, partial [Parmales sp. scaly parma]